MTLGSGLLKVMTIITGIVIAGEALALVVGMHVVSARTNPWISFKNDLFLALDVIAGGHGPPFPMERFLEEHSPGRSTAKKQP